MKGLGARHHLKYNRIKDFPLRAWSRQPMICRAQPKLGSSYTRHERPGSPSPVEIQRNQGYSIMAAWSRQLMICRAQPKLGSSYTRNERLESPSPSPSPSQFLVGQLSAETTPVNYSPIDALVWGAGRVGQLCAGQLFWYHTVSRKSTSN